VCACQSCTRDGGLWRGSPDTRGSRAINANCDNSDLDSSSSSSVLTTTVTSNGNGETKVL